MSKLSVPDSVKEEFYNKWQEPQNYKILKIKDNQTTTQLKEIYNNNTWDLNQLSKDLKTKTKVEHVDFYNAWLNGVYLLDYSKSYKMKTLSVEDFFNYEYIIEGNTETTEKNYITTYKAWINKIIPERKNETTMDWVIINQNKVLLKLMKARSGKNRSMETLRRDINVILKLLKLSLGEKHEMVNKYKLLNKSLSLMFEMNEKKNILSKLEKTKFIDYNDLLKIRKIIYNKWENEFENTGLDKYKNPILRINNIISLLVSFYTLFPPMRTEPMGLIIVKSEDELNKHDASIYIKDKKNIILSFQNKKKGHKPISFNLNDPVIKSFSKKNVNTLINDIIESVELYPREYLFINSNNKQYSDKSLQKILYNLIDAKNIGVNSFRSSYISYWYDKLNQEQIDRLCFIMRTSSKNMKTYYLKKDVKYLEEDVDDNIDDNDNEQPQQKPKPIKTPLNINLHTEEQKINKVSDNKRVERHTTKKLYLNDYYENNKEKILQQNKLNSKLNYGKRIARELNNNVMSFKSLQDKTVDKWKIKYNEETKLYYSDT
jgi:hypothetical protein